jgi:hypothetical protein
MTMKSRAAIAEETAQILPFAALPTRMECSVCGKTADVPCSCGKPYVPVGERAAAYVKKHPEMSDRAIAAELGISKDSVRRARSQATGAHAPVGPRVGRDGKTRRMPAARTYDEYFEKDDLRRDMANFRIAFFMRVDLVSRANIACEKLVKLNIKDADRPLVKELARVARDVADMWTELAQTLEHERDGRRT